MGVEQPGLCLYKLFVQTKDLYINCLKRSIGFVAIPTRILIN